MGRSASIITSIVAVIANISRKAPDVLRAGSDNSEEIRTKSNKPERFERPVRDQDPGESNRLFLSHSDSFGSQNLSQTEKNQHETDTNCTPYSHDLQ